MLDVYIAYFLTCLYPPCHLVILWHTVAWHIIPSPSITLQMNATIIRPHCQLVYQPLYYLMSWLCKRTKQTIAWTLFCY